MQIFSLFKSKLVVKNILWNSLDALVYPALLLISTPIFVDKLGIELYGVWMFVNTIMASIGVLNAGLGDATIKFVSKYIALDRRPEVNKIIGATYSIYLLLAAAVVLVSVMTAFLINYVGLFNINLEFREITFYAIIITGITLGFKFIEQVFLSVFKGFDRYDIASQISILGKLLVVLANIFLAYTGYSLLYILTSSAVITFLFLIVEAFLVFRFSAFKKFYPSFEKIYVKEVFSFGIWSWTQSVIGVVAGQIDKFVVISVADIKVFAYYSIALTVFSQIHAFFAASVSWLFAVVSKKVHSNENVEPLYNQSQFAFLAIVTIILTTFFLVKDPMINWWLGEDTYLATIDFVNWFIAYNLILAITIIPTFFLNASGHVKLTTIFAVSTLFARCLCIPIFYYFFGPLGLVLGLIVSGLLTTPFQMSLFYKRVLNISAPLIGFKLLVPLLLFFIIYINDSWIGAVVAVACVLASYFWIFRLSLKQASAR